MKRRLIFTLTLLGGFLYFLQFVLPGKFELFHHTIETDKIVDEHISDVLIVMGAFAVGLGVINITRIHGANLLKARKGWYNSAALLLAMVATTTFGLLMYFNKGEKVYENIYQKLIFKGFYVPLSSTVFSLLAFYIAAAAYRSFRARSVEAAVLMGVAILVMLGQIQLGYGLYNSWPEPLQLLNIKEWILNIPNNAAQRGVAIGMAIAGLAMSLRIWFGIEKGAFFDQR